jgi:hypothetical protein
VLLLLTRSRAGEHPGGAHESTGNKVEAVNFAEDQAHQFGHEVVHPPSSSSSSFFVFAQIKIKPTECCFFIAPPERDLVYRLLKTLRAVDHLSMMA